MSEITSLKKPNIGIRILALISDAAIFFFTFFMIMAWVFSPIAESAFHYSEKGAQEFNYQLCSDLFVIEVENEGEKIILDSSNYKASYNSKNEVTALMDYETDDLSFYKNRLKYYYCSYRTNSNLEYDSGSPEPLNVVVTKDGSEYSPIDFYNNFIEVLNTKDELQNAANEAVLDFFYSNYYQTLDNELKKIQVFIFLPPIVISYSVFYILIPLLFKNGETLAKKVMHMSFVNKNGYQVQKRQIIFRQLLLFIYIGLFSFILGVGFTSFATLGLGVFIYVIFTLVNKDNKSFLDLLAMTFLVDNQKSTWFESAEDEQKRQLELDKKIAEYNKRKPKNKNVIQIGSKIIKK